MIYFLRLLLPPGRRPLITFRLPPANIEDFRMIFPGITYYPSLDNFSILGLAWLCDGTNGIEKAFPSRECSNCPLSTRASYRLGDRLFYVTANLE